MSPLPRSLSFRRFGLSVLALLSVVVPVAADPGNITPGTDVNAASHRSWPAGPYSSVSTLFGLLQTSVPLFSLDGPGRTSIGLSVHHTMNQAYGVPYAEVGGAGLGWRVSCAEFISGSYQNSQPTDIVQSKAGNAASNWHRTSAVNAPAVYARRYGTRADLAEIRTNNLVQGYTVTEQADGSVWTYTRQGTAPRPVSRWYLTSVKDRRNNTVTYSYDGADRVVRMTDAAGRYATLTWGAGDYGQLLRVVLTTPSGNRQWDFNYATNSSGVQNGLANIQFPSPDGGARPNVRFGYDNYFKITDLADRKGNLWHYGYGALGPVTGTVAVNAVYEPYLPDPTRQYESSTPTRFDWNTNSANYWWVCAITDRAGKVWQHMYQNGVPSGSPNAPYALEMSFPIVRVQDPTYTGALTGGVNAWETFEWNYQDNTLKRHVDREGNATEFAYDTGFPQSGLPVSETRYLAGAAKTWRFLNWRVGNATPRRVRTLDPDGRRSIVGMDWTHDEAIFTTVDPSTDPYAQALGQNYQFPGALNLQTNYTYSLQGELEDTWMGNDAHAVNTSFDDYGNARTSTDPAGNSTTFTYDAWGNKTSQTGPSPLGTTTFEYDAWDRLIETTLPDGHTVGTTYDANDNVTDVRKEDGVTHVTTRYDGNDRPTSVSVPTGTATLVTQYGYDLRGSRVSMTNPRNYTTFYDPDERGATWQIHYPGGRTLRYAFDGNGRPLREINGRGQKTEMRYDGFGRLVLIDHLVSADVAFAYRVDGPRLSMTDGTGTTTYAYDDAGRRTSVRQGLTGIVLSDLYWPGTNRRRSLAGGAQTWTYAYDAGLRPASVGQTLGAATPARYAYHPSGAVARADYGNGTSTYLYYDARGRATNLYHTTGLASNQIVGYRYGADGLMDAMSDTIYGPDGQPSDPSWFTTYAHDRAGRLVSESRANYYGPGYNSASAYAYDAAGNRTGVTRDGVAYPYAPAGADDRFASGEGFATGAYDADGNPGTLASSAGTMGFSYDERGRVASISGPGASSFRYDGDGRRVERVAGGATTRFVYDGDQAVVETDGSNRPTLYRLPGVGFVRNGAQRYEQGNALGSVLAVRDASGAVVGPHGVRRLRAGDVRRGDRAGRPALRGSERLSERRRDGDAAPGGAVLPAEARAVPHPRPHRARRGDQPLRLLRRLAADGGRSQRDIRSEIRLAFRSWCCKSCVHPRHRQSEAVENIWVDMGLQRGSATLRSRIAYKPWSSDRLFRNISFR